MTDDRQQTTDYDCGYGKAHTLKFYQILKLKRKPWSVVSSPWSQQATDDRRQKTHTLKFYQILKLKRKAVVCSQ